MGSQGLVAAQRKGLCPGCSQSTHVQFPLENVLLKYRVARPGLTQPRAIATGTSLCFHRVPSFSHSTRAQLWHYGRIFIFFLSSSLKESVPQKFRKYLTQITLKDLLFKVTNGVLGSDV